jgi:DNA polymerase-3 subunit alpha (Gram-positive type)
LEKLSRAGSKNKVTQTHRALDDTKLLLNLLEKMLKLLQEKEVNRWKGVSQLIDGTYFPNRGRRVKVLARNQQGLTDLYRLITVSHTKNLFKKPTIFRGDLIKHRQNLLIGAVGGVEGEIFQSLANYATSENRLAKLKFYDYVEVFSPQSFRHL